MTIRQPIKESDGPMTSNEVEDRKLYRVTEVMTRLSLSRSVIYELTARGVCGQ